MARNSRPRPIYRLYICDISAAPINRYVIYRYKHSLFPTPTKMPPFFPCTAIPSTSAAPGRACDTPRSVATSSQKKGERGRCLRPSTISTSPSKKRLGHILAYHTVFPTLRRAGLAGDVRGLFQWDATNINNPQIPGLQAAADSVVEENGERGQRFCCLCSRSPPGPFEGVIIFFVYLCAQIGYLCALPPIIFVRCVYPHCVEWNEKPLRVLVSIQSGVYIFRPDPDPEWFITIRHA